MFNGYRLHVVGTDLRDSFGNGPGNHTSRRYRNCGKYPDRGVTGARDEVSRAKVAAVSRSRDKTQLWNHRLRDITQTHQLASGFAQSFQSSLQVFVRVQFRDALVPGTIERGRRDNHYWHPVVDTGYTYALNDVASVTCG